MIKVYTFVVGDLFHVGHLRALKDAKALGDYLVVGVLTDHAVESYKRTPVMPFEERLELISELAPIVDEVVPQYSKDPTDNLKKLGDIDILAHGDDWGENYDGSEYMRSIGKKAVTFAYHQGVPSSTKLINTIYRRCKDGTLP